MLALFGFFDEKACKPDETVSIDALVRRSAADEGPTEEIGLTPEFVSRGVNIELI